MVIPDGPCARVEQSEAQSEEQRNTEHESCFHIYFPVSFFFSCAVLTATVSASVHSAVPWTFANDNVDETLVQATQEAVAFILAILGLSGVVEEIVAPDCVIDFGVVHHGTAVFGV